MARHVGKHGARHSLWGGVAVFVVIALTGFLLSTNVRVNRTVAATNDTADLVEQGVDEANQLQQDVSDLTKQVANLTDALKADGTDGTDSTQNQGKDSSNVDSSLMLPALSGSGVTVTLDDSPLWENAVNNNGTTANINDYVIHQQDVESVVNALWAGGADALMIMDQRVLFNSAVICSGNVLSLHGKKYSPPFTISAIGDPQRLRAALNDSEAITILKQYVTAFGIGYKVENAEDLQFPATAALLQQLKYATVDTSKTTELLITAAVICALYIVWQMWWTGVEAERAQNETTQSVDWSDPSNNGGTVTIAKAQEGDAPVQPKDAKYGDLIAQIYIPRFGSRWHRNIVEGTTLEQLNRHGLGHYDTTQMPGQVGNFAVAGHRNGYGQPLGDVDKLQEGDPIIVRTKDYWYVYHYTRYEIVLPTDVHVIAPNPEDSTANPTKRMITLTTCEPKYSTPTHRWISYGELAYWAKVSDGVPKELATTDSSGAVMFSTTETPSIASRIGSLDKVVFGALVVWLVLFIAAAVAWRWPVLREIRAGERRRPDASIYGGLLRLQPGVAPIRWLLLALLLFAAAAALFQWGFPWAAANIPFLQQMSNFVAAS